VYYRTYRLVDRNQKDDPSGLERLCIFLKRLKHEIEETFGGEVSIEVLHFLRTFKEAAEHNRVSEGAPARLITYFLKGIAKEGYRAQLGMLRSEISKLRGWKMLPGETRTCSPPQIENCKRRRPIRRCQSATASPELATEAVYLFQSRIYKLYASVGVNKLCYFP
jgi:hypothetical protein